MKIKELREILMGVEGSHYDELDVKVLTAEPSIGARSFTRVSSASFGFDWDSGLLIRTEEPLIPKPKKEKKVK